MRIAVIRYRFCQEPVVPASSTRKRRQSAAAGAAASPPQARASKKATIAPSSAAPPTSSERRNASSKGTDESKIACADTESAIKPPRSFANGTLPVGGGKLAAEGDALQGDVGNRKLTTSAVMEVLRDAMCGLCSEVLLDAAVLPCAHTFCKICWVDHAENKEVK